MEGHSGKVERVGRAKIAVPDDPCHRHDPRRLDGTAFPIEGTAPNIKLRRSSPFRRTSHATPGQTAAATSTSTACISLWGFDPNRRPPGVFASVDGIPHFLSSEAGRAPARPGGRLRPRLVHGLGGEGRRVPAARCSGLPPGLPHLTFDARRLARRDDARALEARGRRRPRGRPPGGVDRRRAQRRVRRVGARARARRRCSCTPSRRRASPRSITRALRAWAREL